jgi:hypothetical protein
MRSPISCLIALVGVIAAATTGCATTPRGTVTAGSSDMNTAYDKTVDARTARVSVDLRVEVPRSQSYVLAEGEVVLSNSTCALTVLEMGTTVHELLAGNVLYIELPAFARATNSKKPWAEVVLRSGRQVGPGVAPSSSLTEVDPLPMLDLLQRPPKSTVLMGSRIVAGQASTEYRLMYSEAELNRPFPAGATSNGGGGLPALLAQIVEPFPKIFPIDVWLDGEGRLVQLAASATLRKEPSAPTPAQAALANSLPTTVSVTFDLADFGTPVKFELPAAADVARLPLSRVEAGLF